MGLKTTEHDKKEFIQRALKNLEEALIERVPRMPENWDGWELRQYIVDKADENIGYLKMDKKRKREYENDRLTLNL